MKKYKWLSVVLILVLLLSLAACNSSTSSSGKDEKGKVTLRFMYWGSAFEKKAVADMLASFEKSHPNIHVIPEYVPNDGYAQKINTLMASNNLPDVGYLAEDTALKWGSEGKVMDMTQYLEKYPDIKNRLPQSFYNYEPGKTLGSSTAIEVFDLFYNKDLFKAAGVDAPPSKADQAWTWDEFVQTAQKLTLDQNGKHPTDPGFDSKHIAQYGITIPVSWYGGWLWALTTAGGSISDETGKKYTLNSPEAVDAFQKLQDLIYKYHVMPTPTAQKNLPSTPVQLQTKKVAMAVDGQWNILDLANSNFNFGIGVLPKIQKPVTVMLGAPTVVFASTKHPKEALELYRYHNDPKQVPLFSQGLWMPLQQEYYTDSAKIDSWTKNDAHPAEFKDAVIDYAKNNAVPSPAYYTKNFIEIDAKIEAGLDLLWTNKKNAKEVLDDLEKQVQPVLQGRYDK
ncbi:ABC transporter substrate-binding protein [Neobacillus cucumis]|uniref:ABC transporter substrate-binding protein n=1 Tax=Neobacillus cucumis TaxID=1740721 RepID=UPI0021557380|nr:sugar ABC transporter substrate-binding protein [Neobacillus cucumis]